jgi:hypothetical protein
LIVTTNLDHLIPRAYFEQHRRPINVISNLDSHRFAEAVGGSLVSSETALAQIHGDIGLYRSWRLTRTDYAELLADRGYDLALKALFLKRLFFIGFGMQDEDFDLFVDTMAEIYPPGAGKFYALIGRSKMGREPIQKLIDKNGLQPIYYLDEKNAGSDPYGGHRGVFECLDHLATAWVGASTDLDVTLKYFAELDPHTVGRHGEIERLTEFVAERGRVAQVVGLGGLGKTSLVQRFLEDKRSLIAESGYHRVFGCSFYRANVSQFINDMAVATKNSGAGSIPQQVDGVCEYVKTHRTLVVLDGTETILDAAGRIGSTHINRIVDSTIAGGGAVVITSRVPVRAGNGEDALIEVNPLDVKEIAQLLDRWGLGRLGEAAYKRIAAITAGHPLAVRILAGVLQDVPAAAAIKTIEHSAVIDVTDEVDPLRENRLARIFGSYLQYLNESEIAFLDCATLFERPASYSLMEAAFTRKYGATTINEPLVGQDLRPVVGGLLRRRLLTISTNGELTSHPTVREYFARHAERREESLAPLHRYLATENLRDAAMLPTTFAGALPLIAACRHAAICGEWDLFDHVFRHRLMGGFRDYLCESLGAWDEALSIARLGDSHSFPTRLKSNPGYYPVGVARCLKHLGRSDESRAKYLHTLIEIAPLKDPDTAMYVNNFLTLLIWRGELRAAEHLVELNIRALSWIQEPWRRRWQVEHGLSSIAYLRLLQGNLTEAATLFDSSDNAWDRFDGERPWIYDYYPFYRSELTLLRDPNAHDDALADIEVLLAVAESHRWPESICRGVIQIAIIELDRALVHGNRLAMLEAERRLDLARSIKAGTNVADVAIALHLAQVKLEFLRFEMGEDRDLSTAADLVNRLERTVESSGLALAMPEVIAARGLLAHHRGASLRARDAYEYALRRCQQQDNILALTSPHSSVVWLGNHLDVKTTADFGGSTRTIELLGSELSPDWMVEQLEHLTPPLETEQAQL